ncbi:MAG: PilZ domain-containing protein [Haliangium ochraceum]
MNYIKPGLERRFTPRVRVEMFLNQYVRDLPFRALATNLSATGLLMCKLLEPRILLSRVVSIEFEIPGTGEVVWARAEPRFDALEENFHTSGLTFTAMAGKHERLLKQFVLEKKYSPRPRPSLGASNLFAINHRASAGVSAVSSTASSG